MRSIFVLGSLVHVVVPFDVILVVINISIYILHGHNTHGARQNEGLVSVGGTPSCPETKPNQTKPPFGRSVVELARHTHFLFVCLFHFVVVFSHILRNTTSKQTHRFPCNLYVFATTSGPFVVVVVAVFQHRIRQNQSFGVSCVCV